MKYYSLLFILFTLTLTSCIKDEPLNSECDILSVWIEGDQYKDCFYQPETDMRHDDVLTTKDEIIFTVKSKFTLTNVPLHFNLTPGATIIPENGSEQDFTKGPVTYIVTSQDGEWKRKYRIEFREAESMSNLPKLEYNFENVEKKAWGFISYYSWYEYDTSGNKINIWATGNQGFGMGNSSVKLEDYPTVPDDNGYEGKCVKMQTLDAGPLAATLKKYIAAGNLFTGEFDISATLTNTLLSTLMGKGYTFTEEPVKVTGYYKYRPGAEFRNGENQVVPNRIDEASIYSVLYRNADEEGKPVVLDGGNVLTSKYIVSKAEVKSLPPTDEWTPFEMFFEDVSPIDHTLLKNRGYNLALVFSSSKEGANFCGAIGSTLYVDKVVISLEKE